MEGTNKEKDLAQLSYEELAALAKSYGVTDDVSPEVVQLDALVILKIIKHCKENLPELVTGQLLGLDVGNTLEVTNCFPFPSKAEGMNEAEEHKALVDYQVAMMYGLREANVDYNTVGWYTSTICSYLPESLIADQFKYQKTINKCVVVVYDPLKTSRGELAFKAYRLTDSFMELYKDKDFKPASLARAKLQSFNKVFEEIPIKIHRSSLVEAFLLEFENNETAVDKGCAFECLDLAANSFLETTLDFLIQNVDKLPAEQEDFREYQRNLQRANLTKKKLSGDSAESKPIFEPSQLNTLLIANQMNLYCKQIYELAGKSIDKLHLLEGFHQAEKN